MFLKKYSMQPKHEESYNHPPFMTAYMYFLVYHENRASSKTDPEPRWDIVKTRASTEDNY